MASTARLALVGLVLLVSTVASASAQTTPDVAPRATLLLSPLHLLDRDLVVGGEYLFEESWGVAGMVGLPSAEAVALQVHYYAVGTSEHGMQIGFELSRYAYHYSDAKMAMETQGRGAYLYAGYKYAHPSGLTAVVQAGSGMTFDEPGLGLQVHSMLGWSF